MPPLLALRGAVVHFGGPPLFRGLDVALSRGERAALVGRNGGGKSTLIKALAGLIDLDEGERYAEPGARVAILPQEAVLDPARTIAAHVADGLAGGEAHRVAAILSQLALDGARLAGGLSGGETRRVALARALVGEPDVLLLDEPTNHLDLPTIEWLEAMLRDFAGAVLTISHDRAFLTRVATRVLWLERGQVRALEAGYAGFEEWSEKILDEEAQVQLKLGKFIDEETQWLRQGVKARRTRNEGRKRRLMALRAERAQWIGPQGGARLSVATEASRSKLIIEAEAIAASVPTSGGSPRRLFHDFSFRVMRGDRIGIVGPNGAGKTTLVRLLTGQDQPESGRVRLAKSVHPGILDQKREALDPDQTLARTLVPEGGDHVSVQGKPRHVVSYMRDFLFDASQARQPVASLSGGERNRLLLAKTLARPSNLLVLDEPTNDLDMDTLDLLIDMLDGYDGTIIAVSHDRDFLDRVVNGLLVMRGDGTIEEVAGGYSDWRATRDETPAPRPRPPPRKAQSAEPAERSSLSFRDARELEALPDVIARLEAERAGLEAKLADGDFYARDPAGFAAATARHGAAMREIAAAEERWLELESRREDLERRRLAAKTP